MITIRRLAAIAILATCAFAVLAVDKPATPGLGWMSGHWCSDAGGERVDEYWLPEAAGQLQGMSRTVAAGRVRSFEFLRIAAVDGVPTYLAQPSGNSPTAFKRTAGGANWVRFENPAHDFPQRIEYRRDGERLSGHIAGPGDGGKEMQIDFALQRCD